MSLQDDHFDLEEHFKAQINNTKAGTPARKQAVASRDAYRRVWGQFVDQENENEKLRPVVAAISTVVRHVIDTHYIEVK